LFTITMLPAGSKATPLGEASGALVGMNTLASPAGVIR
jgi:hypothetical protein